MLCYAPSQGGLRMFVGSSHGLVITPMNIDHAIRVFYSERASIADDFGALVPVPEVVGTEWTCPLSVTADGCELTLQRTVDFSSGNGTTYNVLAKRTR